VGWAEELKALEQREEDDDWWNSIGAFEEVEALERANPSFDPEC
jgi:hypothetical protein